MTRAIIKIGLVAALLLLTSNSHATFSTKLEAQLWVANYYTKPEPEKAALAIQRLSETNGLANPQYAQFIVGFIAGVLKDNPNQLTSFTALANNLDDNVRGLVPLGIWHAKLPQSKQVVMSLIETHPVLKQHLSYLSGSEPLGLDNVGLDSGPWVINASWGYFSANGRLETILRIIKTLPWADDNTNKVAQMTGTIAYQSLLAYATNNTVILKMLEQQTEVQPPEVMEKLIPLLAAIRENKAKQGK